jgi:hypothetical protein
VWRGRLGASEEVTSPGGVVCAFYDAEVRLAGVLGRPGPLLSRERAWSSLVLVRGEQVEAAVSVTPASLLAPVQVRRCSSVGSLVAVDVASGEVPPPEAFSHERVGKLGEVCLVVGEVAPGPAPGTWRLQGPRGGPATLVVGEEYEDGLPSAREMARRGWLLVAASAVLCAASAFLLAR